MQKAGQRASRIALKPQKQACSSNRPTKGLEEKKGFYTDTEETRRHSQSPIPTTTACACRRRPPPCLWWQADMGKHCRRGPKPRRTGGRALACFKWKRYGDMQQAQEKKQPYLQTKRRGAGRALLEQSPQVLRDWRGSSQAQTAARLGVSASLQIVGRRQRCQAFYFVSIKPWSSQNRSLLATPARSHPGLVN